MHQLVQIRSAEVTGKLTEPMLHYLAHWYYPILRELIVLHNTIDCEKLGSIITPSLKNAECKEGVSFLLENSFIIKEDGNYRHTNPQLTTGDEVVSTIVSRYHRESLLLSAEDLSTAPPEYRDISSLILSLSEDSFLKIKKEIQLFRKKLLHIAEEEQQADRVYHIGFQMVPRSKWEEK